MIRIAGAVMAALVVAGCGSHTPSRAPSRRPPSIAQTPYAKPSPPPDTVGPYRFVRPPLVVRYTRNGPPPEYLVFVHLNRPLPVGEGSATIALDDVTDPDEGRGHDDQWGYDDEFARPPCYTKWIMPDPDVPSALHSVRPGQRVVVHISVRREPSGELGAAPRVVGAARDEAVEPPPPARWRAVDCRPP